MWFTVNHLFAAGLLSLQRGEPPFNFITKNVFNVKTCEKRATKTVDK